MTTIDVVTGPSLKEIREESKLIVHLIAGVLLSSSNFGRSVDVDANYNRNK
jgi:hypothetical protein